MKKFYKNQLQTLLFIIVLIIGIASCRKEVAAPSVEKDFSKKQLIKEEDLLKTINENPGFKMLTLDWSKAKQTQIEGKAIVRVPTINMNKLDKLLPQNDLLHNKSRTLADGNPNFYKNHPPEVFFIKEKDSVNPFLLNFVPTNIGIDTGKNGIWTGKLYEWNLKGNIIHIQDIDNSKIKRNYLLQIGDDVAKTKNSKGISTQGFFSGFFDWLGGIFSDIWDGINWLGFNLGIPGAYEYDDFGDKYYRTWEFGGGDGGNGGSYGDGGGSGGGGYYYGAGEPGYNGYLPGYNPNGDFGSPINDPYQPYPHGGPSNNVLPIYSTALTYLISTINLSTQQIEFLQYREDVAQGIENYLLANGITLESVEFASWSVGYVIEFPDADVNELLTNNNIPNDNINLPILDTSELTNYPAFKELVEDLPNFLNNYPNVLKALEITTGLKQKKIKELMQPGKGPKVRVINNLKDEYGNDLTGQYDIQNKVLRIDKDYVIDLSKVNTPIKYNGLGLILTITTLHEFVHYGRDINNLPKRMVGLKTGKGSIEAGVYFEDIIMPPGSSPLEPTTAQGWLRYYSIKYRE